MERDLNDPIASAPDPGARASEDFRLAFSRIEPDLELVEQHMRDQFGSASELIPLLGDHVLAGGGKRIRPALVLLAAELCGYTGPRRIHIGAAIEFMHTASLLHDDVVDLSELRRGRPSVNALWGNRRAVLAGDFFYARASSIITDDGNPDILRSFVNAIRSMSEGELLQLQRSYDPAVTEAHYFAVIERKSAVLLSTSCETGAILADVTRAERQKLSEFGHELGVAFQLCDDALDYSAHETELGKRPYTDLREGKVTLPLLLTLKRSTPAEQESIVAVLKAAQMLAEVDFEHDDGPEPLEFAPVIRLVERYRGVEDTLRRAEKHRVRAEAHIKPFSEGLAKQGLLAALRYSVYRDR